MSGEGFFRRWSRLKASGETVAEPQAPPAARAVPQPAGAPGAPVDQPVAVRAPAAPGTQDRPQGPLPTLEDAARLTSDADFSSFVAPGVDKSVQRLALKKLFADPHFNAVDGLDMYMSDYTKASPLTPAMLASLQHAQGLVARLLDDQQRAAQEQAAEARTAEAQTAEVQTADAHAAEAPAPASQADALAEEPGPAPEQGDPPPSTQQGNA
ncbi:DUF3306 domain-containing protein [Massilia consociata]|uniref:DUF3306 domain-containing protein n=1 Tax=Massilia consociata TaxID=760117 RepID=A0ABV6FAA2_9BURK